MTRLLLCCLWLLAVWPAARAEGDPPLRALRVAQVYGEVELRPAGSGMGGVKLERNWSLGPGWIVATDRFAASTLQIGSSSFTLDAESELEILQLNDVQLHLRLLHGGLEAHIHNPQILPGLVLENPEGQFHLLQAGHYQLNYNRRDGAQKLRVFSGQAQLLYENGQSQLRPGQEVELYRGNLNSQSISDEILRRLRNKQERPPAPLRFVAAEMTGQQDLAGQGEWLETEEYGPVWRPHNANFMPFRDGYWQQMAPWGWVWVDHVPWAYVTSHYGRWAWHQARWVWAPGPAHLPPAWSPALVGWTHQGRVTFSPVAGSDLAWFPLAPREFLLPWYAASPNYQQRINQAWLGPNWRGRVSAPERYHHHERKIQGAQQHYSRLATVAVPAATPAPAKPAPLRMPHHPGVISTPVAPAAPPQLSSPAASLPPAAAHTVTAPAAPLQMAPLQAAPRAAPPAPPVQHTPQPAALPPAIQTAPTAKPAPKLEVKANPPAPQSPPSPRRNRDEKEEKADSKSQLR
ncbi:DUF6600 domain-containing protein [Massilia sp. W12]|uniref:DUF6600 domain-containing protein n=1 Tax=Massilia sp. W12 TaxID=3126507 RepID=UPI0030D0C5E1